MDQSQGLGDRARRARGFTSADGNVLAETAVIASILATVCFLSAVLWAGFGVAIGRFLKNPAVRGSFN